MGEVLGASKRLKQVQAASGVAFLGFLLLHLMTTTSAIGGQHAYDRTLAALRRVYRPWLPVELLLIGGPLVVHLVCAVMRSRVRKKLPRPVALPLHLRVHRAAGYYLLLAIFAHVFSTRVMNALASGPTATGSADFSFVAHSLLSWPVYGDLFYFSLVVAAAAHLGIGLGLALKLFYADRISTRRALKTGIAVGAVIGALATLGMASIIREADTADRARFGEFRATYARFAPFLTPSEDGAKPPPPPLDESVAY